MSNQWHYSQEGAQYGPVDEAEIVRLIQDGELAPGTPVCKEGGMDWQPARNHACFQVEIYPQKKHSPKDNRNRPDLSIGPDFEAELLKVAESTVHTAASTSGGGTSQPARKATVRPTASSNPAVVPATEENLSGLSWVVIGVASLVLVGVIVFMDRGTNDTDRGSDTPPPATTGATIPHPPAPNPQLAQTYFARGVNFHFGNGGESKDYAEAVKWYRKAADMGNANAQNNLGVMYDDGEGVPEDDKEAVAWYRKAALQGNARAQSNLGSMYSEGKGVLEDDREAVEWYRKAALQGYAGAQTNLGFMYANGYGVPEDDKEAVKWYRKAALQEHVGAQTKLGFMYAYGEGVPEDDKEAVAWYRKAALQGYANAQFLLGVKYANGEGVPRDYVTAYAWYNIAAANGYTGAATRKDNAAKRLTPAQINQAQALSRTLSSQIRTP